MSEHPPAKTDHTESNIVDSLQSLIVAFVLAMTFRGFVTEGFVIPTGSMAPTLMGQHILERSKQTGFVHRLGAKEVLEQPLGGNSHRTYDIFDPILGPGIPLATRSAQQLGPKTRMGDRILVLKSLYPFSEPNRFDVVVFKNPTNPDGESENYIKRLAGLPGEKIWLVDGDVFAGPAEDPQRTDDYRIQRKPEHVQRAVWQLVHHSDYLPRHPDRFGGHDGPPWGDDQGKWTLDQVRRYRCEVAEPTTLEWDAQRRTLDDWTPYNTFWYQKSGYAMRIFSVSDLRISAGIVADQSGLETSFELAARSHVFEFSLVPDGSTYRATVRYRRDIEGPEQWIDESSQSIAPPPPGRVVDVEFWHVDQSMAIYVNGDRVVNLAYGWLPEERLEHATGVAFGDAVKRLPTGVRPTPPELRWHFRGSPVTLHRVRVDRDLYYQPVPLNRGGDPGYGTHPNNPAVLGPDQFFMLGDNSPASLDSRLWGDPHPLVSAQIDDSPFVVNRKLLLGKAWVVYFPAPYRWAVPDFGRLRFIR
ncbi:MAG: S26 family signal peptidase [Planctomycetota bacterium]|jgi:signal peptidase I